MNNPRSHHSQNKPELFQSVPAKTERFHQPLAKGLPQLRKRAGQNGGKRTIPSSPSEPFPSTPQLVRLCVISFRGRAVRLASQDSQEFGAFCFAPPKTPQIPLLRGGARCCRLSGKSPTPRTPSSRDEALTRLFLPSRLPLIAGTPAGLNG